MVRKDKMILTSDETIHYFISIHLSYQSRDDWLCGDNEHSRPEKENENDARSPHTAIRPTSTLTNPK